MVISKWKPITTTTPTAKTTTVGLNPAGFMAAQPQDQRKSSGLVTNIHGLIDGGSYTSEASPGAIPQCTWQAASSCPHYLWEKRLCFFEGIYISLAPQLPGKEAPKTHSQPLKLVTITREGVSF